jgi:hypothetical protein
MLISWEFLLCMVNSAAELQQGCLSLFAFLLCQPELLIQQRRGISSGWSKKQREFNPRRKWWNRKFEFNIVTGSAQRAGKVLFGREAIEGGGFKG